MAGTQVAISAIFSAIGALALGQIGQPRTILIVAYTLGGIALGLIAVLAFYGRR